MQTGNNKEMAAILREFKLPNGAPNYPTLYSIPNDNRIRDMAKRDFNSVNMLIIGALTVCFEGMNLKRGMNEMQILTLSELIIDSSTEDNLAFEDFMLFMQNMLMGKYEMTYESMDIPKFMKMFEIYRQERWSNWVEFNENRHLEYKALGDSNRYTKKSELASELGMVMERMEGKNETIKQLRTELNKQSKINNF